MGGGKMGSALIGGLIAGEWCGPTEILAIDPSAMVRDELTVRHPGLRVMDALPTDERAGGAVIAVKPQYAVEACRSVAPAVAGGRVLSIAAGVTLASLEVALGPGVAVVRSMPNTPAVVGLGASAIACGASAGATDLAWARSILERVGIVEVVPESQLDAVTGLSGSGPAYVFLVAEALIEGGVLNGLPRATAEALAIQTLRGAAALLAQPGAEAARLRADVTSPGGTTAAGLKALEAGALRHTILEAVTRATQRSRELGG